jgi:hypothetical protein
MCRLLACWDFANGGEELYMQWKSCVRYKFTRCCSIRSRVCLQGQYLYTEGKWCTIKRTKNLGREDHRDSTVQHAQISREIINVAGLTLYQKLVLLLLIWRYKVRDQKDRETC